MRGARKPFCPELADWSSRADRELPRWLRVRGYEYTPFPDGSKGIDGLCESDSEKFKVEVERRSPLNWSGGEFPFPTIHVPERRARYGDREWLLFVVRKDVRVGRVVFPQSLKPNRLTEIKNRYVERGELFFDIPIHETLPIDLTETEGEPIAVMNAKRIREAVKGARHWEAITILGDEPPYGIGDDEWREMLDASESDMERELFCGCKDKLQLMRREPDTYRRSGWHKVTCGDCGRFFGYSRDD